MSATPAETVRLRLQRSTRALHDQVDGKLRGLGPFASRPSYARFLRCMLSSLDAFHQPLDHSSVAAGLDCRAQFLRDQLAKDLRFLGEPIAPAPTAPPQPHTCAAQAWGVGYAFEGSSMGSRVLLTMAHKQLGDAAPSAFLTASAQGAATRWPMFLEALESAAPPAPFAEQGAQSVFRALLVTLAEQPAEG